MTPAPPATTKLDLATFAPAPPTQRFGARSARPEARHESRVTPSLTVDAVITPDAIIEKKEAPLEPQLVLALGDVVADRYRVRRVIGAGGMGIVYEAKHLSLDAKVALKVIRPDIARNSSTWRRFAREARALAALHNKHVVRVHDAGTLPSGLRYLVMELLEGTDLRRVLDNAGPPPRERAVDYVLQVCSALGDAHRLGIIHRDIKPENIFLAQYKACDPVVKLLDFGLALFLDDTGQLTLPGRGVGSPRYLSPEQLTDPGAVDGRSDLWAVGLLLYELLAGRSPFHGSNAAETCLQITSGAVPRIESHCPNVPAGLADAVHRCLKLDRAERPQSADELITLLDPFSSRHPREVLSESAVIPKNGRARQVSSAARDGRADPRWLRWLARVTGTR